MNKIWISLLMFSATSAFAETSIHRCAQADGTVAFQEMPCPDPATDKDDGVASDINDTADLVSNDDYFDTTSHFDVTVNLPVTTEPSPMPLPSADRAICEKTTRDAIDVIDLDVRKAETKEKRLEYLAELLELTKQLRACKQL